MVMRVMLMIIGMMIEAEYDIIVMAEIDAEPLCENKTDFRVDFRMRFFFCLRVFLRAPLARGFVVLLWIVLLRAVCSPT